MWEWLGYRFKLDLEGQWRNLSVIPCATGECDLERTPSNSPIHGSSLKMATHLPAGSRPTEGQSRELGVLQRRTICCSKPSFDIPTMTRLPHNITVINIQGARSYCLIISTISTSLGFGMPLASPPGVIRNEATSSTKLLLDYALYT